MPCFWGADVADLSGAAGVKKGRGATFFQVEAEGPGAPVAGLSGRGLRWRQGMATVEERLAFVEGRLQELAGGYAQLREDIRDLREHVLHLDQKVDRFREELSGRIESLGARMDALDDRLTRWLRWLVGILVTALLTQIGVLSAALLR